MSEQTAAPRRKIVIWLVVALIVVALGGLH